MILQELNYELSHEIRKGIMLPSTAMARLLNGKNMIAEIKHNDLKSRIYTFMETQNQTTVTDIVEHFKLEPDKVVNLLDEMEKEGKIRQN